MNTLQISSLGFVVVKLAVRGMPFYLMRADKKWRDLNFVGGHYKDRDCGSLEKTARRELWEEVPSVRMHDNILLEPLTTRLHYGPIYSISQGRPSEYLIQFFLLKMDTHPHLIVDNLGARTKNRWISEIDIIEANKYRISSLARVLGDAYPGGYHNIPYSSELEFDYYGSLSSGQQLDLNLTVLA